MVEVVRTKQMEWQNGLDVIATMEPAWRDNLGPAELVNACYAGFNQKQLTIDPVTTARGDLQRLDPGYADLTDAYHDSVEEAFFLAGDCTLSGDQVYYAGDYFWRPPGFIHAASTVEGFDVLIFVEGENEREESHAASRVIRPTELAGTNGITADLEKAVGPRGWVRVRSQDLPWLDGHLYAKHQGDLSGFDLDHLEVKVLSHNHKKGGQSVLMRLAPGHRQTFAGHHSEKFVAFVVTGSVNVGDEVIEDYSWLELPAGEDHPALSSPDGATLFVKISGFLDFTAT